MATIAAVAAVALLVSGCTGGEPRVVQSSSQSASTDPGSPGPNSAEPEATPSASSAPELPEGTPGTPQQLAGGLDTPWGVAFLPDGSALITLRDEARVIQLTDDGDVVEIDASGPDGVVPDVAVGGEGGLLGIAVSQSFSSDSLVYLYRTGEDGSNVFTMRLGEARLSDPTVILDGIEAASTHNGGRLAFGPDGSLYVSTGDAQNRPNAQNNNSLNGKILRIAADGSIPDDNPFEGSPVFSFGHRNVQGMGWDSEGNMWASEFGQDRLDELNLIEAGGNYGWPEVEGDGGGSGFIDPLVTWPPGQASPSGLAVTQDAVYLAALRGERLWRVPRSGTTVRKPEAYFQNEHGRLRAVAVAPDNSLWLLTNQGPESRVLRVPLD
ncbi:PQQ-dependent sugar dehydrogenase [Saxibacter everestensis]|uniref:PQQ-dependent sugar dehydrogenase n=1 Tax=Saxibacter everestensis TaxID=2909229 RepID=A0ABY8QNX1_9MICO|nr:PQQ-dependent sugar dehydrogenase [Brevibacteriaceae bacterium ZFBP1038]